MARYIAAGGAGAGGTPLADGRSNKETASKTVARALRSRSAGGRYSAPGRCCFFAGPGAERGYTDNVIFFAQAGIGMTPKPRRDTWQTAARKQTKTRNQGGCCLFSARAASKNGRFSDTSAGPDSPVRGRGRWL